MKTPGAIRHFLLFTAYFAIVALVVLEERPSNVVFPNFAIFVGFCVLPCIASWLLVVPWASRRFLRVLLHLIVGYIAFLLVCRVQLKGLTEYAITQSSSYVEGVLSNFVVYSHEFLLPGSAVAIVALALGVAYVQIGSKMHAKA